MCVSALGSPSPPLSGSDSPAFFDRLILYVFVFGRSRIIIDGVDARLFG